MQHVEIKIALLYDVSLFFSWKFLLFSPPQKKTKQQRSFSFIAARRRVHNRDSILIEKCIIHNFEVVSSASFIRWAHSHFQTEKLLIHSFQCLFDSLGNSCKRGRTKKTQHTTRNSNSKTAERGKKKEKKMNVWSEMQKTEIIIMFMPCMRRLYVVYNVLCCCFCFSAVNTFSNLLGMQEKSCCCFSAPPMRWCWALLGAKEVKWAEEQAELSF